MRDSDSNPFGTRPQVWRVCPFVRFRLRQDYILQTNFRFDPFF